MTNLYLNAAEYARLSQLVKRRYCYRHGGREYGMDVLEGALSICHPVTSGPPAGAPLHKWHTRTLCLISDRVPTVDADVILALLLAIGAKTLYTVIGLPPICFHYTTITLTSKDWLPTQAANHMTDCSVSPGQERRFRWERVSTR